MSRPVQRLSEAAEGQWGLITRRQAEAASAAIPLSRGWSRTGEWNEWHTACIAFAGPGSRIARAPGRLASTRPGHSPGPALTTSMTRSSPTCRRQASTEWAIFVRTCRVHASEAATDAASRCPSAPRHGSGSGQSRSLRPARDPRRAHDRRPSSRQCRARRGGTVNRRGHRPQTRQPHRCRRTPCPLHGEIRPAARRWPGHARPSAGPRRLVESNDRGRVNLNEMSATRYDNPQALRQALADRLRPLAEKSGMELSALLRRPETAPPLVPVELSGVPRTSYRVYPIADHIADKICGLLERHLRSDGHTEQGTRYRALANLVTFAHSASVAFDDLRRASS